MRKYDWKLISVLSLPGPVMGLLTLYGVIADGTDRWFWLVISIACALVIARRVDGNAFGHGAFVGLFLGVSSKLIQGLFSGVYAAHNPDVVEKLADSGVPGGMEFQYYVLMLVPFVGIANALLVGLMSHFAYKALPRKRVS
jgi:hypothetical protein